MESKKYRKLSDKVTRSIAKQFSDVMSNRIEEISDGVVKEAKIKSLEEDINKSNKGIEIYALQNDLRNINNPTREIAAKKNKIYLHKVLNKRKEMHKGTDDLHKLANALTEKLGNLATDPYCQLLTESQKHQIQTEFSQIITEFERVKGPMEKMRAGFDEIIERYPSELAKRQSMPKSGIDSDTFIDPNVSSNDENLMELAKQASMSALDKPEIPNKEKEKAIDQLAKWKEEAENEQVEAATQKNITGLQNSIFIRKIDYLQIKVRNKIELYKLNLKSQSNQGASVDAEKLITAMDEKFKKDLVNPQRTNPTDNSALFLDELNDIIQNEKLPEPELNRRQKRIAKAMIEEQDENLDKHLKATDKLENELYQETKSIQKEKEISIENIASEKEETEDLEDIFNIYDTTVIKEDDNKDKLKGILEKHGKEIYKNPYKGDLLDIFKKDGNENEQSVEENEASATDNSNIKEEVVENDLGDLMEKAKGLSENDITEFVNEKGSTVGDKNPKAPIQAKSFQEPTKEQLEGLKDKEKEKEFGLSDENTDTSDKKFGK